MELHNFFKTFETFVPKNVEGRDQKRIDTMVNMQNKMLTFLIANPEFGKQVENFYQYLKTFQENCYEMNNEQRKSIKQLDLSKLKDLEEITKFFSSNKVDDDDSLGLGIFNGISIDPSDIRKMRALKKMSENELNIYSEEKILYEAIKSKIYSKQDFVVKTPNYEVVLDFYKLTDWYGTFEEKRLLKNVEFEYNTWDSTYYVARSLNITNERDPVKFLKMVEEESPGFPEKVRSAYNKVLTNMKRGKAVETKYLDFKERKAEGLKKLDDRDFGITEIIFFKKPKI